MQSDIERLYQLIHALTSRINLIEAKLATMDEQVIRNYRQSHFNYPLALALNTTSVDYSLSNYNFQNETANVLNNEKIETKVVQGIHPTAKIDENSSLEAATQPCLLQNNVPIKEISILESNKSKDKKSANDDSIRSIHNNKQKQKLESCRLAQLKGKETEDDASESLNRLSQMKKEALQDMANKKITKMIKNHRNMKDFESTSLNIGNKRKQMFDISHSIDNGLFRKHSSDNLKRLLIEQKRIFLKTMQEKEYASVNSSCDNRNDYESFPTYRNEQEKRKRLKEMAINRRKKAREISLQNRKQASMRKEKSPRCKPSDITAE